MEDDIEIYDNRLDNFYYDVSDESINENMI